MLPQPLEHHPLARAFPFHPSQTELDTSKPGYQAPLSESDVLSSPEGLAALEASLVTEHRPSRGPGNPRSRWGATGVKGRNAARVALLVGDSDVRPLTPTLPPLSLPCRSGRGRGRGRDRGGRGPSEDAADDGFAHGAPEPDANGQAPHPRPRGPRSGRCGEGQAGALWYGTSMGAWLLGCRSSLMIQLQEAPPSASHPWCALG